EGQRNQAGWTVPLLRKNELGISLKLLPDLLVCVALFPHQKGDEVGIPLKETDFSEISHTWLLAPIERARVELDENHDRDVEFFREGLDRSGDRSDFVAASVSPGHISIFEKLEIVDDNEANIMVPLEIPRFDPQLCD